MILALKAERLLHKGCEAYLAYVVDKSSLEVTMDSVPIVREFTNMFLEDFPGLPPDRELKFEIELLMGSTLISIRLYRMALAELKKLKIQLQDIVEKGFI